MSTQQHASLTAFTIGTIITISNIVARRHRIVDVVVGGLVVIVDVVVGTVFGVVVVVVAIISIIISTVCPS